MPENKTNTTIKLAVKTRDGQTIKLDASALFEMLGIKKTPDKLWLEIERDETKLIADVSVNEQDYPGVTVDAIDKHGNDIFLGGFELPNEDYPNSITARLYAGYSETETDEPICLVRHALKDSKLPELDIDPANLPHKLVYVDTTLAEACEWDTCDENNQPEHREDVNPNKED